MWLAAGLCFPAILCCTVVSVGIFKGFPSPVDDLSDRQPVAWGWSSSRGRERQLGGRCHWEALGRTPTGLLRDAMS